MQSLSGQPAFVPPCADLPLAAVFPEAEFQPQLAVDPRDPERLAVVWTQGLFLAGLVGVSEDGGRTWRQRQLPVGRCAGGAGALAADPWIVWGADGSLHVSALTGEAPLPGSPTRVVVTRSTDGGETWSQPAIAEDDGRRNDRPSLAVDPSAPERLYLAWTKGLSDGRSALAYAASIDGGRSWTRSRVLYESARYVNGHHMRVLADGTLLAFFFLQPPSDDESSTPEMVLRSDDDGVTWQAIEIARTDGRWPREPDSRARVIGNPVPTVDVTPAGDVLVSWQDIPDEASSPSGAIRLARSADGGRSWSRPRTVRSGAGEAWDPTLAVHERGLLALTWYDTRADRRGDGQWTAEVRIAHSHDAGRTWEDQRLAGPFDVLTGFAHGPGFYALGNYFGLRPIDGGFGATFSTPEAAAAERPQDVAFGRLKVGREGSDSDR